MSETQTGGQGAAFDLSQFHGVFFEEAGENLANMETLLLGLDVDAADDETLNAIFRCAHSIKGGAATFGFQDVADLTHVMETLLDKLRRHELAATTGMIDTLLESGDVLEQLLARHRSGTGEAIDSSELVARIGALANGTAAAAPVAVAPPAAAPASAEPASTGPQPAGTSPTLVAGPGERALDVAVGPLDRPEAADHLAELFAEIPGLGRIEVLDGGRPDAQGLRRFRVVTAAADAELLDLFSFHVAREQVRLAPAAEAALAAPTALAPAPAKRAAAEREDFGFFVDLPEAAPAVASAPAQAAPAATAQAATGPAAPAAAPVPRAARAAEKPAAGAAGLESSTIRVPIEKVDQLINLVGELVITQAMLAQTGRGLDPVIHQSMATGLTDLERNTRMLQESVMAIRMIPMAVVFNRFPRMLRDLASKLGKQVELQTIGEDTELDKGLIEKITDPLTHLVRNAADHGIEQPEDRIAAGKPAQGTVTLAAAHQGGSIVIEVRDDGRGLNRGKLLKKAAERGLAVHDQMTDQEVYGLIFEPGFSTAAVVTDVSGRGVGMDVVKRNITSLGGSVEIDSTEGQGMRVSVRLPLTLAIMDGMSVGVEDETYIVPLASVVESIHLSADDVKSIGGNGRVVEVRNEYLPLLALDELFAVPRAEPASGGIMIVVEAEGGRIALVVDELIGQHQVVVKNLESNYRKVPGVSGATILGDGRVALILDVSWLVRRARH
ncbi:MAG: chemotaxis protein CheW [Burkholderiaceae bacterium]|jgi:two-component system chemotaxis sensor kinase CheA|nr:chemotaxis protein CheW [Burkholderiales bacterium]MCZ8340814.1 chemotaxis protein CheW [Burkholderiaceae bacterium]